MVLAEQDTVLGLFAGPVICWPDHIAVDDGRKGSRTYRQLDKESTDLAASLKANGVRPGHIVPIVTTTCIQMVVGILGIMKAGAVYVPIDRERCPRHRIEYVINKSQAKIVLYTGTEFSAGQARAIRLPMASVSPDYNDQVANRIDDVLAIIFTSGTTNKPKGVRVRSSSVARFVTSPGFNYDVTPADRVLLVLSVGFDACMGTMFNTLCNGGTLVLADSDSLADRARESSIIIATPSILAALGPPTPAKYSKLRRIVLGGETASEHLLDLWDSIHVPIWIAYGPTEATCAVLTQRLQRDPQTGRFSPTRLGHPIPGSTIMLLNPTDDSLITELKTPGEIGIAGPCLSAGYLDDAIQTSEKFIHLGGHTTYRTGDIAEWVENMDGTRILQFHGREDRLIKNRGFLVNLDQDVDQGIIRSCPSVQAAYSLKLNGMLCTAIVSPHLDTGEVLTTWKSAALPYAVPDHFIRLPKLPLSSNGKVDPHQLSSIMEKRLQKPRKAQRSKTSFSQLNQTPKQIVLAWFQDEMKVPSTEIDLNASCMSMGVSSLAAVNLSSFCGQAGYAISVADILEAPSLKQVFARCRAPPTAPSSKFSSEHTGLVTHSTLSPLQHKMVLETKVDPRVNYAQHISYYRTQDIRRIKKAWETVTRAEPIFWTVFTESESDIIQQVVTESQFHWEEQAVRTSQQVKKLQDEIIRRTALGMSVLVLRHEGIELPRGESMVVWTTHRALLDGFSSLLLLKKLDLAFQGHGIKPSIPFAQTGKDLYQLRERTKNEASRFWEDRQKELLESKGEFNIPDTVSQDRRGPVNIEYVHPEPVDRVQLNQRAKRLEVTSASILHAAWALLVSLYSNSSQVMFGMVLSGRDLPFTWAPSVIGPLINQLPYNCAIKRQMAVSTFVQRVHKDIRDYARFQLFESPVGTPPITTMLVVQDNDMRRPSVILPPLREPRMRETTSLPLVMEVQSAGGMRLVYRSDRFTAPTIQDVAAIFRNIVHLLTSTDDRLTVGHCLHHSLPSPMHHTLLQLGNTDRPESRVTNAGPTLGSIFRNTVSQYPDLIAVTKDTISITYRQLLDSAQRVASAVLSHARPGDAIAVIADRSINWIIGVWAAVLANTAYCPIDASFSIDYQVSLVMQSRAPLVLFPSSEQRRRGRFQGVTAVATEEVLQTAKIPIMRSRPTQKPSDVAYVCFTSGSTGVPKGVKCLHRGLVALQSREEYRVFSRPGRRIAQFLSPGFGGCVFEVFGTLCYGATLVLRAKDDDMLSHLGQVDATILTPSVAAEMVPWHFPNIKFVYFAGEPATEPIVARWWSPERQLYNAYGSTEATVMNTLGRLAPDLPICLGSPVPSSRLYILNDDGDLVPPNTVGHIHIAGVQVSDGYINTTLPKQNEFQQDPFVDGHERMYRTGDLGHFDHEGNLWYCSRKDRQVKVRGYRVNLDDITHAVYRLVPTVRKAVAVLREDSTIVLVVCPGRVDEAGIREALRTSLPPHYQPSQIQILDKMPTTKNGKMDLQALKKVNPRRDSGSKPDTRIHALNGTARAIAEAWKRILSLEPSANINGEDDFFKLGGDSISMLKLARELNDTFQIRVTVRDVVLRSVLRDLAALIDALPKASLSPEEAQGKNTRRLGTTGLSPPETLWVHYYTTSECQSAFNVPFYASLSPRVDLHRLASSVEETLNRHRILRTRIKRTRNGNMRTISDQPIEVAYETTIDIGEWISEPFQLDQGLVRAAMTKDTLLLNFSHLLCDNDTLTHLLQEIGNLYHGKRIPAVKREYFDEEPWSFPVPLPKELEAFWSAHLTGLEVPRSLAVQRARSYRGASVQSIIPVSSAKRLRETCADCHVSLRHFALGVVAITLQTLANTRDVVLGCPYINHSNEAGADTIGLHLEPLPLRFRVADSSESTQTVEHLLRAVETTAQSAVAHAVPWHALLALLGLPFPSTHEAVFDCAVTFREERSVEDGQQLPDIDGLVPHPVSPDGAIFALLFEWRFTADEQGVSLRLGYNTDLLTHPLMDALVQVLCVALDNMLDLNLTQTRLRHVLRQALDDACLRAGVEPHSVRDLARKSLIGAVPVDV
ncbi:acetyl-CoA synthetase-like protein [Aspergillus brunneoviolaceus CBS 621.78]|uniref:Acetyl-CoA synthetase-like protein n=1 Tax=Aspergillus brunneoviolaceus CBS 621.78 TaxID=1450534 RepID=A0ACD1GF78_9EURO|nr:acetyl-CoA synthetase-like protein [Aspergillus brunneoviolaceus CBS 621.78]RAH47779.1 acetyl-CoA synthetase-like protein [Aspergillus brunneoviolaceus CBS 621.78]